MNVSTFIARRIAFNNQRSFSRFIIRLAMAATALSVAAMIVTLSFVNGFQKTVGNKVFSFWGHLRVQKYEADNSMVAEESILLQNDTVVNILKGLNEIQQVQAFATKSAVIENDKEIEGVMFKGVDSNYDFNNMENFIVDGKPFDFKDSSFSKKVLISQPVANELKIKTGDTVNLYFILQGEGTAVRRRLMVSGIFKTGIEEFDKLFAIGDIRLLRKVYDWNNNEIGGYEIFLKDYTKADSLNVLIYNLLPQQWISRSTKEIYPYIFNWLQIQDVNRNVIFIIMSIVAIINLITCLLILVLERTRMIGVIKALGESNGGIQKIFLYHATIIAGAGIFIGFVVGTGICLLQQYTGFITMDETAYYVSVAPVEIIWWQVALVCGATLVVCFLALMIPTLIVRSIKPVKAIQFR